METFHHFFLGQGTSSWWTLTKRIDIVHKIEINGNVWPFWAMFLIIFQHILQNVDFSNYTFSVLWSLSQDDWWKSTSFRLHYVTLLLTSLSVALKIKWILFCPAGIHGLPHISTGHFELKSAVKCQISKATLQSFGSIDNFSHLSHDLTSNDMRHISSKD